MPTVPSAERQVVAPGVRAPSYLSPNGAGDIRSFGANPGFSSLASDIEKAASAVQAEVLKQQHEDNVREAKNLDTALSQRLRAINYGDGTADNPGFLSAQGESALASAKATQDAIRQAQLDVAGTTKNERVRLMFGDMARQRVEQELTVVDRHVKQERQAAENATSAARLQSAVDDASKNYLDPAVLDRSQSVAVSEVVSNAQRLGWGPDVIKAKTTEAKSAVAVGAIKAALASEDTVAANKLFEKYGNDLTGAARVELTNGLRTASVAKQAQALRDTALAKFPNDYAAAIKWVMDNADGKVEDEAFSQVQKVFGVAQSIEAQGRARAAEQRAIAAEAERKITLEQTRADRARRDAEHKAYNDSFVSVDQGGRVDQIPLDQRSLLNPAQLNALETLERKRASGAAIVTDYAKYGEYTAMGPNELVKVDLAQARTELADAEFTIVRGLVTSAQQAKTDPNSPESDNGAFNAAADNLGLTGADKRDERGRLRKLYDDDIAAAREAKGGKPLTRDERNKILEGLTDTFVIKGKLWDSTYKAYEFAPKVLTPEIRKAAIAAYQSQYPGKMPPEREIIYYYVKLKEREASGGKK